MEAGGGMVAVVQGLGAGLAVTLMDGCRRYTLMPNETGPCTNHTCAPAPHAKPQLHAQQSVNCASQYTPQEPQQAPARSLRENSVQATDGRYASTYKTMHCNVSPTSPPQAVTEFPPQRTEVVRGQGNFVIGGTGSGATCSPAVRSTSFRGGMCWPDRGSVCASRPSVKSDAFASSLRKYPGVSPERSAEIVERLISYTQAKHLSKNQQRHSASPTRNSAHSISSRQTFVVDRNSTKQSETDKLFDQDVMIIKKIGPNERVERRGERVSQDENGSSWNRFLSCRNNEVRCFRDTNRNVNQEFRNYSSPASGQFSKPSSPRYAQNECHLGQRPTMDRESDKSVDMEIQAATKMESKEILTLPRIVPMQRTVGTSLTPMPSKMEAKLQDDSKSRRSSSTELAHKCKAIQVNARITSSSEELRHNIHANTRSKRSKSKEELGNRDVPHDIKTFYGLKDLNNYFKFNNNQLQNKEPLLKQKRICENCKHLFEEFETLRKSVSDNTYLRENLYFEMNPDETNKDLKYILRHYERKANNLMNKSKCKRFSSPDCVNKFDFSQSDSSDNARTLSRYSETENENGISDAIKDISIPDKYDHHSNDTMDKFVERKRWQKESHCDLSRNDEDYYNEENYDDTPVVMTQNELRNLIDLDILAFTEKYRLNMTTECLNILIEEIFDLFVMNLKCNISPNKDYIAKNIKHILQKRGLSEFHSVYLSNILAVHWEEEFLANNKLEVNPSKIISETLIVLSNITQNIQPDYNFSNNKKNESTLSINEISQIDTNVDAYVTQISNEIDEWLTNLKIPQSQDKDLRQKVMNDLANEIMDRHKYLAMKQTTEVSSSSELEYLKYQIFKWIHKLVCDADMTPVEHASDLMKRIQTIPVPMFSLQRRGLPTENWSGHKGEFDSSSNHRMNVIEPSNLGASTSRRSVTFQCCKKATCKRNLNKTAPVKPSSNRKNSLGETQTTGIENTRRKSSPDRVDSTNTELNKENSKTSQSLREQSNTQTSLPLTRSISATKNNMPYDSRGYFSGGITIKDDEDVTSKGTGELPHVAKAPFTPCNMNKINEDYVQYLNEWVKEIPIRVSNCAEQTLADKTRMDICNQIWAVVSRLRTVPETFNNRFLFEDMLEEEIEKILSNVTTSEELNAKKYILKARIIEKTGDANELMKSCCAISYKHQLINGINDNLPKFNNSGNNYTSILNIYEELQILNIVENFIIYLNYQNEDKVLAEAYKNKLVKCTEEFVEKLKENYSKELNDINTTLYRNDILDALKNVPVPSEETLQEEVNDILLSLEIDKWLSDLPLTQNDDAFEQLQRKRLRNNLAKQIRDIEKKSGQNDGSFDNSLKQEVSQFLGKISLPEGESLHINSMVEDLIERLKTRPKTNEYDSKKVAFNEPDYDEFSKNMPFSSTFSEKYNINRNSKKQTNAPKDLVSDQSFNRHYHNISKPLLDDLQLDRNDKATPSMQQIPNIKSSNQYRIPSSSIKSSLEPQWHTIEESKHEFPKSCNLNDRNRSGINEMVREIDPNQQSSSRHYHDIAKPLLDDMQEINPNSNDAYKSIEKIPTIGTSKNSRSRRFAFDSNAEPHWYTLYKSRHESNNPEMLSENFVHSSPRISDENPHSTSRQFGNEFVIPQKYLDKADSKDYRTQSQPVGYPNNSPKRVDEDSSSLSDRQNADNRRRTSYPTQDPRWAPSRIPYATSLKRHDSPKFTQQKMTPDNLNSFNETPFHSTFQDEANRHFTNRSGFEDTNVNRHNRSPDFNRSDEFYKSTDQEGIRKIIERNKSLEANLDRSGPANDRSGFYQQSYSQGPPDYRCYRDRRDDEKTYMRDSFHEQYREDESENDDEDDIRCRCVKKVLKSKRRPQFCPLDQYDGYPMCVRSPYFYPYFYY